MAEVGFERGARLMPLVGEVAESRNRIEVVEQTDPDGKPVSAATDELRAGPRRIACVTGHPAPR